MASKIRVQIGTFRAPSFLTFCFFFLSLTYHKRSDAQTLKCQH